MSDVSRRKVLGGTLAATTLLAAPNIAMTQETALKFVWLALPEAQWKPLFDEFAQRHPKIKLAIETIPFNQIYQTLEVRLGARTSEPDIFLCDSPMTASFAARGHLLDVDSIIDRNRLVPSAIPAASYQNKLYAAPFGSSSVMIYYNRRLFREAGIELPSIDPAKRLTWEQVYDIGKKISKPGENVWGLVFEQSDRPFMLLPLGQSLGGKAISDDGFPSTGYIDAPPFVEAYTFMQKLYADKVAPTGQLDPAPIPNLFAAGKVGMMVGAVFTYQTLRKLVGDYLGVTPDANFAKGTPGSPTGAWNLGINPRTLHKEAALQAVSDLLSDDLQITWAKLRPYPPTIAAVWDKLGESFFSSDMWKIARYEQANTAVIRPVTPGFREYEDILRSALRDIQFGANVQASLTAAARKIDREIVKYKS